MLWWGRSDDRFRRRRDRLDRLLHLQRDTYDVVDAIAVDPRFHVLQNLDGGKNETRITAPQAGIIFSVRTVEGPFMHIFLPRSSSSGPKTSSSPRPSPGPTHPSQTVFRFFKPGTRMSSDLGDCKMVLETYSIFAGRGFAGRGCCHRRLPFGHWHAHSALSWPLWDGLVGARSTRCARASSRRYACVPEGMRSG